MTGKRFKVHTVWFNPEKTDGEHTIKHGGQPLITTKSLEDAKLTAELLNTLFKENMELKNKIKKKNEYQRVLEGKITRLKDRVKTLEKK